MRLLLPTHGASPHLLKGLHKRFVLRGHLGEQLVCGGLAAAQLGGVLLERLDQVQVVGGHIIVVGLDLSKCQIVPLGQVLRASSAKGSACTAHCWKQPATELVAALRLCKNRVARRCTTCALTTHRTRTA